MGSARLLLLAVVAVPTYHGYYLTADATGKRWAYFVAVALLVLAAVDTLRVWLPLHVAARWLSLGALLCWWIEVEAVQQAVCGVARWRQLGPHDVCVDWLGGLDAYRVVASVAVAGMLTWRPSRRQ